MSKDPQIEAAARALIAQYGEDAETIAMLRAAEFAALQTGNGAIYDALRHPMEKLMLMSTLGT